MSGGDCLTGPRGSKSRCLASWVWFALSLRRAGTQTGKQRMKGLVRVRAMKGRSIGVEFEVREGWAPILRKINFVVSDDTAEGKRWC